MLYLLCDESYETFNIHHLYILRHFRPDLISELSVLFAALLYCFVQREALTCYSCTNVTLISDCHTDVDCGHDNSCFLDLVRTPQGVRYTLGCRSDQQCPANGNVGTIVGRAMTTPTTGNCQECCSNTKCNKKLCSHDDTCRDSGDLNCETTNSIFDICADINHAKGACRRFCGLCDLVDGNWSPWSSWSGCDVTCNNGTQTRIRTCTDPAPAAGGSNCTGLGSASKVCSLEACPIHGAWSLWSSWGSCSVSCGIGMQRRDRSCSNPYPSRFGDHCFGEGRDERICLPGACANGGWSTWSSWGTCSVTCGGGIKTRERLCNNPSPSPLGSYCPGHPYENIACSSSRCPEIISAFTVTAPHSILSGGVLTFSTTIINQGSNFNPSTGLFTCTHSGIYYFTVSLVKKRTGNTRVIDMVTCYINKNGSNVLYIHVDPTDDATDGGSAQATHFALLHLNRGDVVKLSGCSDPSTTMDAWSSFSGFLLNPDL